MNLKDYYSQKQLLGLLQMRWRQQLHRWLNDNPVTVERVCGRPFYSRADVYAHLLTGVSTYKDRVDLETRLLNVPAYNLDLTNWVPYCKIQWPMHPMYLYRISLWQGYLQQIRTKRVYGLTFFNVEDIKEFLNDETK